MADPSGLSNVKVQEVSIIKPQVQEVSIITDPSGLSNVQVQDVRIIQPQWSQ